MTSRRFARSPVDRTTPSRSGYPKIHEVEGLADPKGLLIEVLLLASEATGRRRDNLRRDFGRHRSLLIQRLDRSGRIRDLPAWRQLEADVEHALSRLRKA